MKKPLIVGNWKLYVHTLEDAVIKARKVARGVSKTGSMVVICPPTPFLDAVSRIMDKQNLGSGAQTISVDGAEARTGEYTASMIASLGAAYVIIGHSERRAMAESDEVVKHKLTCVLSAGLSPILCIGEHSRDTASGEHFAFIENQLRTALSHIDEKNARNLVIAYEPVWAIGKTAGDAMNTTDLEETILFIRKILVDLFGRTRALAIPILYGGSVEPSNASSLIESGAAGFLVGHASVEPASLLSIAKAATEKNGSKKR